MKSYHFSILHTGIPIVWPWLFRRYLLLELSSIVIYPFVFYSSTNMSKMGPDDLDGNMVRIFVKQQEELLQAILCLLFPMLFIIGLWALLLLLIGPLLLMFFLIKKYKRKKRFLQSLTPPYAFAYLLSDIPFFMEAYANCNYPKYLQVRKIFAWVRWYI